MRKVLSLTHHDAVFFERMLEKHSGQILRCFPPKVRKRFLESRLASVLERTEGQDVRSFKRSLRDGDASQSIQSLVNALRVDRTSFFRRPAQFRQFEESVKKNVRTRGLKWRPRVLCVGASTGEEVYSILASLRRLGVGCQIDALDVNADTLAFAAMGTYPRQKAYAAIPKRYRLWDKEGAGWICFQERRGERLRFQRANLLNGAVLDGMQYDYVFCRNVAYYFSASNRQLLLTRLAGVLGEDAQVFWGIKDLTGRDRAIASARGWVWQAQGVSQFHDPVLST